MSQVGFKSCTRCGQEKSFESFHKLGGARQGYRPECRVCRKNYQHDYYHAHGGREVQHSYYTRRKQEHPEALTRNWKRWAMKNLYGISLERSYEMLEAQGGTCWACPSREALGVDHNRLTGRVRGILCRKCNAAFGLLGEDVSRLEALIRYKKMEEEVA